jgi:hypothetical protein
MVESQPTCDKQTPKHRASSTPSARASMKRERDEDESSDDEMGPMPEVPEAVVKKKRKG